MRTPSLFPMRLNHFESHHTDHLVPRCLPWLTSNFDRSSEPIIALIASHKELSLGRSVADTRAGWRWDARISLIPQSRIPRRTKHEVSGAPSRLFAAGASRGSLLVKGVRAFLVPEITASEHCSDCSARLNRAGAYDQIRSATACTGIANRHLGPRRS